jgi:hypothetical protein
VSYRFGVGGGMVALGFRSCDPAIICDGCGLLRPVVPPGRKGPPAWFLDGKAPPKWKLAQSEHNTRRDFCPRCKP